MHCHTKKKKKTNKSYSKKNYRLFEYCAMCTLSIAIKECKIYHSPVFKIDLK